MACAVIVFVLVALAGGALPTSVVQHALPELCPSLDTLLDSLLAAAIVKTLKLRGRPTAATLITLAVFATLARGQPAAGGRAARRREIPAVLIATAAVGVVTTVGVVVTTVAKLYRKLKKRTRDEADARETTVDDEMTDVPAAPPAPAAAPPKRSKTVVLADPFGGIPLTGVSKAVLAAASSSVVVEIFDKDRICVHTSPVEHPTWGSTFESSEEMALKSILRLEERLKPGDTLRITSALEPWEWIYRLVITPLLVLVEKRGAKLSIITCRKSDADVRAAQAHLRVFTGKRGHLVVRIESRVGLPRFGEPQLLVEADGRCNLVRLARVWDPHSFGNAPPSAFIGKNKDLYETVRRAAIGGTGSNVLHETLVDTLRSIDAIVAEEPLFRKTIAGTATIDDWLGLAAHIRVWDRKLTGANAGANYVMINTHPTITVDRLAPELKKSSYNVTGMDSIREALKARRAEGGGADVVVAPNSGETTDGHRVELHVGDKAGGNALARALARAYNKLEPGSVTVERSVRTAWTSAGSGLDAVAAGKERMRCEPLLDAFMHTQQAPADAGRADGRIAHTKGVFVLGTNFISGGSSVGDPLRAASRLQAGEQGHQLLSTLFADPYNIVAVYFLIDRLGALTPPIARAKVLELTAKQAYAKYVGSLSKSFEERRKQFRAAGATDDEMADLEVALQKISDANSDAGASTRSPPPPTPATPSPRAPHPRRPARRF